MARFDVYSFKGNAPLVVDVQADILDALNSRIVIPLLPRLTLELRQCRASNRPYSCTASNIA